MTRQDYLNLAAQRAAADPVALELARRFTSATEISMETAELEKSAAKSDAAVSRWSTTVFVSMGLLVAVVVGTACFTNPNAFTWTHFVLAIGGVFAALGLFLVSISMMAAGSQRYAKQKAKLKHLRPIAGSDLCQMALSYVESGHAEVLAWRDLALAEREQLYGFDVEVMRCLHDQAGLIHSEAQRRAANAEACRKLHGITA